MAATPQADVINEQGVGARSDGDRIVISGMAGLYPQANNVKELSDILYNKKNPISTEGVRYKFSHPEAAQYGGKLPDVERFDAQFFKVHYRMGNSIDPMSRKVLEQTYHAIYDAGMNPEQLSGKKVGVFIGSCFSESEKTLIYAVNSRTGLGISGCSKTMYANRISYWLNTKGPSMAIAGACCSSAAALEQAYLSIKSGQCEAAIVGGTYLCLHPQSSVHYGRIIKLCPEGKTKSFDENADGLIQSEAINVLFIQKAKDALRVYADIVHVKTQFVGVMNGNSGPRYGFYRDPMEMTNFLKTFYEEANTPPQAVEFVEAYGTAIPEVDKTELEAFDKVFCNQRNDPLLVGSVMSNIGYSEAASGISAITKVLLGYHYGEMAANLHCERPRRDVAALREGRMRIATEHQRFGRTYTAVNGMSFTGINSHVLLHGHYKPKDLSRYKSSIPYLVTISARMDSIVKKVLEDLKSQPIDPEELALLHNIHQTRSSGHLGRGFTIIDSDETQKTVCISEKAEFFDVASRPLWFVYSGMGSQWAGMGAKLMRIPIFAAAIERCMQALEPRGIDIVHIITSPDKTIFDNILHSFVGIAAVQIGLTDILRELGLEPDGIIGHSVGELGCAYADGCLTVEEMILSAYSRGLVSLQTPFIRGSMAAVGLGYQQIKEICPSDIEVACHNGPESCTISGPADAMRQFVAELTAKNIFAKEVPCSNIAYHSRYIAEAGPGLLKYLKEVIVTPKLRSSRWISSSVPEDRWGESLAQYSSAEYHTNNLLSPVLFEETCRLIPSNAVLVEVAPHGLLQAILKRSLPASCTNIALTRRGHSDNTHVLLEAIGKLYMEGYNPKVQALYPKVELPVSTGTPFLSHFVKWSHDEAWAVPMYSAALKKATATCNHVVAIYDRENAYIRGNVIRGRILYPYAATLVAVWDTLAMTMGAAKKQLSVEFTDVHLHAQPPLHDQRPLRLSVALNRGNGCFEVLDEDSRVASGIIKICLQNNTSKNKIANEALSDNDMDLTAEDIYTLLDERDYSYSGEFRSIVSANFSLSQADLQWRRNWVALLDGMLQLNALRQAHDGVSTPTHIRRIGIDVEEHNVASNNNVTGDADSATIHAEVLQQYELTRCGGIEIEHVQYYNLPSVNNHKVELSSLQFIPRFQFRADVCTSLQIYLQIVKENVGKEAIHVVGITDALTKTPIFDKVQDVLDNTAGINIQYKQITEETLLKNDNHVLGDVDIVLLQNLSTNKSLCHILDRILPRDTFIINEEERGEASAGPLPLYRVLSTHITEAAKRLELVRWKSKTTPVATIKISVRTDADLALLECACASTSMGEELAIVTSHPPLPGLKQLVLQWRKELNYSNIYLLMEDNDKYHNCPAEELPAFDLVFNVVRNNILGGEYYVPIQNRLPIGNNVTLQCANIGSFDSLSWIDTAPDQSVLAVTVHYAGLSTGDVKRASGGLLFKDKTENMYGMDFSGTTERGERVMGIVRGGSCSARVRAEPRLLWPVPAHWSLEDAATVPLAYAHAFYCLGIKGQLAPGMTVLVHGGAGALGQAAISIALAHDCTVFTTVSDMRKKHFLRKLFPELKDNHIGNSRDDSFESMVLSITHKRPCDFVISTVVTGLKNSSLRCVGDNGIMFDTSQLHNHDDYQFGMSSLFNINHYTLVDFSSIFALDNYEDMKKLQVMVSEGIARGFVRPLSRVTYAPHDAARAFRLLAASRHCGRVLIRMREMTAPALPRLICRSDQCQLIISDDKSLGYQLADRLVSRGAGNIFLHSDAQPASYLLMKLRSWERRGVRVVVSHKELKTQTDVITLVSEAVDLGPVEGIYVVQNNNTDSQVLLSYLDIGSRILCQNIKSLYKFDEHVACCTVARHVSEPASLGGAVALHTPSASPWAVEFKKSLLASTEAKRHFIAVNSGGHVGEQTCFSRLKLELPATVLSLSKPNYMVCESAASWRRCALDAVEHALHCGPGAVLARPLLAPAPELLAQLAAIADINISQNVKENVTLKELGIEEHKLKLISVFLKVQYDIALCERQLQLLTIQNIRQLERADRTYEYVQGLGNFFSCKDSDELLATTEIVFLPTITSGASVRDAEFDQSLTYLCIVPGMEGHHERFRSLCERLKLPALVLQPGLDHPHETLSELAQRYAEVLLRKLDLREGFYLLGYESGVPVALEIAAILEKHGFTGTVFCVGFASEELQVEVEKQLCEFQTEEQLQDGVVHHMFRLMGGDDATALEHALRTAATWPQKVDATVRSLSGRMTYSIQYTRSLLEAVRGRIDRLRRYSAPARPLRSKLVLLRAATAGARAVAEPPALQRYSQQPVAVHQLAAPLAHAAADLRCAALVNQYLHPHILAEFETKNICEKYLVNANSFI